MVLWLLNRYIGLKSVSLGLKPQCSTVKESVFTDESCTTQVLAYKDMCTCWEDAEQAAVIWLHCSPLYDKYLYPFCYIYNIYKAATAIHFKVSLYDSGGYWFMVRLLLSHELERVRVCMSVCEYVYLCVYML